MADAQVAAGTVAGMTAALPSALMGVSADALVLGLAASTLMSFMMPSIDKWYKSAASVFLTGLVAGYGSIYLAHMVPLVAHQFEIFHDVGEPPVALMGLMIGVLGPTAGPVMVRRIVKWFGGTE